MNFKSVHFVGFYWIIKLLTCKIVFAETNDSVQPTLKITPSLQASDPEIMGL